MTISDKLNIPEGLHGLSLVKKAVQELRFQIWLRDISSATVPEYIEHHESIREILKFTDDVLEIIEREQLIEEAFKDGLYDGIERPDPRRWNDAGL